MNEIKREKHPRCIKKISKAPLLISTMLLPPPPIPTNRQHRTQQQRPEGSVSSHSHTLHPLHRTSQSSALFFYINVFLGGDSGGKGSVVKNVQIKHPLKNKTALYISGNLVSEEKKAAAPSESLTAL